MKFELNRETGCFNQNGVEVITFNDNYAVGHQGGITLIMNDKRMATNMDLRFEQTPGQWQPIPKQVDKLVDTGKECVTVKLHYPDESAHLKGFNPMIYPDVELDYSVVCEAIDDGIEISVVLENELPESLQGKASFNMEMPPVHLFGKSYVMDETVGIFPRQPNGPSIDLPANFDVAGTYPREIGLADCKKLVKDRKEYSPMVADDLIGLPYAVGNSFTVSPEDELHSFTITSEKTLKLYDGRFNHNNGWFVLNEELPTGVKGKVLTWKLLPRISKEWSYDPVVQVSNVGYHTNQTKYAMVELDKRSTPGEAVLYRLTAKGMTKVKSLQPSKPRNFLRYQYVRFDFTEITEEGMYRIEYAGKTSNLFKIAADVYDRGVWQPVLEYFLPVQMCHMRVQEKYRVWHGLCHMDDARMAPVNYNHFDGYSQGPETMTKYKPGEHVPGLNAGGWHDAGDYDLRIESQAGEVYALSQALEEFGIFYDSTTIDQEEHLVEIHQPDGKNDVQQQIEHGLLTVLGGYHALGRLYRGIICNDIRQYVLLGDASVMTDGKVDEADCNADDAGRAVKVDDSADHADGVAGNANDDSDDRWVFTEDNPRSELTTAAQLAAAYRVMKDYDLQLANDALQVAKELYKVTDDSKAMHAKIHAAIELFLSTKEDEYKQFILQNVKFIEDNFERLGWLAVRVMDLLGDEEYKASMRKNCLALQEKYRGIFDETPYGVPYHPRAWGAGWGIQGFGVNYYYLHKAFPDIFSSEPLTNALNFILGCHPGTNTASFASGVGSVSHTVAYGANRADYSYIPGGVSSGTELIAPDFPELLEYPFLWQQSEYVLGGGSTHYMFLVLAVKNLFDK